MPLHYTTMSEKLLIKAETRWLRNIRAKTTHSASSLQLRVKIQPLITWSRTIFLYKAPVFLSEWLNISIYFYPATIICIPYPCLLQFIQILPQTKLVFSSQLFPLQHLILHKYQGFLMVWLGYLGITFLILPTEDQEMGKLKYRPSKSISKFWIMRPRPSFSILLSFLIAHHLDKAATNCLCSKLLS